MDDDPNLYPLTRDAGESERLDKQHYLITRAAGYLLHPTVAKRLPPENARIADVATGTGVFLVDLAAKLPNSCQLDGFDISAAQFPSSSSLPSNVRLHEADAKQRFPTEFHGIYDVVCIRYLSAAMLSEDWASVARNTVELLKPGGSVQWLEANWGQFMVPLRGGNPGSSIRHLTSALKVWGRYRDEENYDYAKRHLRNLFEETGLKEIEEDVFCSDRDPQLRAAFAVNYVKAITGMYKNLAVKGVSLDPRFSTVEQVNEAEEQLLNEIEDGAYVRLDHHLFIGFKP